MAVQTISENETSVREILDRADRDPVILRREGGSEYAVMPLDDDIVDLLLERDPQFMRECGDIQRRVDHGQYLTHEQVLFQLGIEPDGIKDGDEQRGS